MGEQAVLETGSGMSRSARRRLLQLRLRQLLLATTVSSFGDGLVLVAFPLLALSATSDPVAIAGVAVAGELPMFLCALPAGALADRVDRRRLAAVVNTSRAAVLGAFALTDIMEGVHLWTIYLTIAVLGIMQVLFMAISQVILPVLLPRERLAHANGQLATAELAGEQVLGPASGGVLYGLSHAVPFIGDAVSFLVAGVLLQRVLPKTSARPPTQSWRADMGEGVRWFVRQPTLRLMATLVATIAFCQAMVLSILALYVVHDLGLSHSAYGLLIAIVAVGNIIGALGASRVLARLGSGAVLILALLSVAGSYIILSQTRSTVAAAAALSLENLAVPLCTVTTVTVRQWIVPDHLIGRVTTLFRMTILGLTPFGALAGGVTAANIGVRPTFLLAGSMALGVTALLGPSTWRRLARLHPTDH